MPEDFMKPLHEAAYQRRIRNLDARYLTTEVTSGLQSLVEALDTGDIEARCQAAFALGDSLDPSIVRPLIDRFYPVETQLPRYRNDVQPFSLLVAIALALCNFDDFSELTSVLATESGFPKNYKIEELSKYSDRTLVCLLKALRSSKPGEVYWAARYLGWMNYTEAVEPLINVLPISERDARSAIATSLGMLGDPRAFDALRKMRAHDKGRDSFGSQLQEVALQAIHQIEENILRARPDK